LRVGFGSLSNGIVDDKTLGFRICEATSRVDAGATFWSRGFRGVRLRDEWAKCGSDAAERDWVAVEAMRSTGARVRMVADGFFLMVLCCCSFVASVAALTFD
jgi:hypothetical protein